MAINTEATFNDSLLFAALFVHRNAKCMTLVLSHEVNNLIKVYYFIIESKRMIFYWKKSRSGPLSKMHSMIFVKFCFQDAIFCNESLILRSRDEESRLIRYVP